MLIKITNRYIITNYRYRNQYKYQRTTQTTVTMKLIRTATTLLLMMIVMSYQSAQAQKCSDVCPNEDRSGCWIDGVFIRDTCNSGNPIGGALYRKCYAWCWCNSFGRNCGPCGTCNRGLVDITTLDAVDDHSEYMSYSDNEKMVELSDTICPEGKVAASYELHRALEALADTNGDGFLSLDEFENAHHDTSDILNEHCVYVNEVEESEEDVVTKALSFIGRNQDIYEEEDPMANFVTQRAKEGEKCQFPFPNCGSGLSCVNRKDAHPVCHRKNKCLPFGFKAPYGLDYSSCCSKTGSASGWCR